MHINAIFSVQHSVFLTTFDITQLYTDSAIKYARMHLGPFCDAIENVELVRCSSKLLIYKHHSQLTRKKSEGSGQAHVQPQINDIMVKTGQFITKCMGDRVIALERQISLW